MNAFKSPEIRCCVTFCDSRLSYKTFDLVKLHPFPLKGTKTETGEDLLLKWIRAIKLLKKYTPRMRVCSLHFDVDDFEVEGGKKELKKCAVPSKKLPHICRNKFFPRDYGRMIKQLEYRGIGKLRLCHEAKLVKRLARKNKKKKIQASVKATVGSLEIKQIDKESKKEDSCSGEVVDSAICIPKVSDSFSLSQDNCEDKALSPKSLSNFNDHNFTSEIMIKEEPMSDNEEMEENLLHEDDTDAYRSLQSDKPEDAKEKEETVEEMLAKMNADDTDNKTAPPDDKILESEKSVSNLNLDYDDTLDSLGSIDKFCNICGEEECLGHEKSSFHCVPCGKVFKTNRQLNAHNLSHFEYRTKRLSAEEQRAKDQMQRETTCKVCHKVLSTKMTLTEHMLIHSGEKPHICMLCDKAFRHKANLVQHVNTHTLINNFRCKVCRQLFYSVEELDRHVRKHRVMKKEYSCRECGLNFRTKTACWAHLNQHARGRGGGGGGGVVGTGGSGGAKSGLPCQVCGRVLSTKATLKEHMFIHSGEKPFECLLCGKKIRHRANFIIHVQGHSLGQPHVCLNCGVSFPKRSELNSHVAAEHPEDRPYNCIICGMRFRTETRFHKHAVTHDATLEDA